MIPEDLSQEAKQIIAFAQYKNRKKKGEKGK